MLHTEQRNHQKLVTFLNTKAPKNFYIKYGKSRAYIYPADIDSHSRIKNGIKEMDPEVEYHTYTTTENKVNTFIIKGLSMKIAPEEIMQELMDSHNIKAERCYEMKNIARPIYILSFQKGITIDRLIKEVKYLNYTKILWEKYRNTKKMSQCHRCQEWGHATSNCYAKPRCLKCAQQHLTFECSKPKTVEAKCANCAGNHPANSITCPVYLQRIRKLDENRADAQKSRSKLRNPIPSKTNLERHHFPALKPAPPPVTNAWQKRSQSITQREETPTPSPNTQSSDDSLDELSELVREVQNLNKFIDVRKMLALVKELNMELSKATSESKKFRIFYNFCHALTLDGR